MSVRRFVTVVASATVAVACSAPTASAARDR